MSRESTVEDLSSIRCTARCGWGARLRLRPFLMTSLAFIFGCLPLWMASSAGSVARQVMGTTVIGGMLAASAIAIFFIPVIFVLVEKLSSTRKKPDAV